MTCTICGNPLPCTHSGGNAALIENAGAPVPASLGLQQHAWRNEVAARVRQHRARRGRAVSSMELDSPAPESLSNEPWPAWEARNESASPDWAQEAEPESRATLSRVAPKIIRFPSQPFSPIAVTDQLVEQEAGDPARILEAEEEISQPNPQPAYAETYDQPASQAPAPQQMELPCFDDIHLESNVAPVSDILEPVPQAAPLGWRAVAGAIDLGVVLLASFAFKLAFTYLAEHEPQSKAALLCAIIVTGALWILYQYLFLVHGKRTVGMVLTDLELSTFGGDRVGSTVRRLRALATAISAFSLGLGFAWALLDEDQLGWHDRMTGTVMREAAGQQSYRPWKS